MSKMYETLLLRTTSFTEHWSSLELPIKQRCLYETSKGSGLQPLQRLSRVQVGGMAEHQPLPFCGSVPSLPAS